MYTCLSVQIKFTEIESMLFSNIFQWRIHVLDKEGDAGGFSAPAPPLLPNMFLLFCLHCFYHVLSINLVGLFNVILLRLYSHVRLPTHLDD